MCGLCGRTAKSKVFYYAIDEAKYCKKAYNYQLEATICSCPDEAYSLVVKIRQFDKIHHILFMLGAGQNTISKLLSDDEIRTENLQIMKYREKGKQKVSSPSLQTLSNISLEAEIKGARRKAQEETPLDTLRKLFKRREADMLSNIDLSPLNPQEGIHALNEEQITREIGGYFQSILQKMPPREE